MKIDIAGVLVNRITKETVLNKISEIVASGQSKYIVTPYSEFIVFAKKDPEYRRALNEAELSLPDGVGVLWASKYLSLRAHNSFQAFWQIIYTLVYTLINPNYATGVIPERIVGSHLIWDIAKLAHEKSYSIALVGGFDSVAKTAARKLQDKFSNLKINLADPPQDFDDLVVNKIAESNSDILLIAYQPPKQEKWLAKNIDKLNVRVAIGLGGTFDYIAGKRLSAPHFMHYMGLEWFWRLVTQPWRIKRIWNATAVFIWIIYRYKVDHLIHPRESGDPG